MLQDIVPGGGSGPGEAFIIPAITGCDCQYRCIALDTIRSSVLCICPSGWYLGNDSTSCICKDFHLFFIFSYCCFYILSLNWCLLLIKSTHMYGQLHSGARLQPSSGKKLLSGPKEQQGATSIYHIFLFIAFFSCLPEFHI